MVAHSIIQQYRLIRLVMIIIIAGLTIFLYTSYYTNQSIHDMPSAQRLQTISLISNSLNSLNPAIQEQQKISSGISDSKSTTNHLDNNSVLIKGDEPNSTYTQSDSDSIAVSHTINSSSASNSSGSLSNAVAQSKLLESAIQHIPSGASSKTNAISSNTQDKDNKGQISSVPRHLDTTKGIRTSDFYEAGHSEVNSDLCGANGGENLHLLILITSAPSHRDARLAIRQTWGHYATRRDIAIAFVLGVTNEQSIEDSVEAESYMYSDIIRGRFLDSYNNLTLKTISALEWVDSYCPRVSFILKTDDDMFINVPRLMSFIDKHHNNKRVIYGRLAKKWKPIRNKKSKYYVSPQQYFPSVFPQFTTGPAYLMTNDSIHDLYTKALAQTYLKLEDVFTTGIVAQLVNVKRVHVNEFLNRRIAFNPCNLRKSISIHMVKSNEQFDLWRKLLDSNTKCK